MLKSMGSQRVQHNLASEQQRSQVVLKAMLNIGRLLKYMDQLYPGLHVVYNFMALDKYLQQYGTGRILYVLSKDIF